MDDILSAVDVHTSQFIYKECLQGSLLRDRTVVLVTHHVGLCLPGADFLVSLKDGRVDQTCPANQAEISGLITAEPTVDDKPQEPPMSAMTAKLSEVPDEDTRLSRHVYAAEQSSTGRVATNHYMLVFSAAGGMVYWLVLGLVFGSAGAFGVGRPIWLKQWLIDPDPADLNYNLVVFALVSTGGVIAGAFQWVWLYGIRDVGFYNSGCRKIHSMLLDRVCAAPLMFFETTPAGRIMNLFGQDTKRMDVSVADDFGRE